jgi:hypothetical protein
VPSYHAPVDDTVFVLQRVLGVGRRNALPGFDDLAPDVIEAVLRQAARFCEVELQPLNATGDRQGCRRADDGTVAMPDGFREAYARYREGGWTSLSAATEWGGQGLPVVLATAVDEYVIAANLSFAMIPGLAAGAVRTLERHGTPEQRAQWLPKLVAGTWTATMNLTEPQCGTDLGLVRSKAVPDGGDGRYRLSGEKIFISGGEHDLSENILHLVLARIEGAPAGTRGLSLFAVPKRLPGADGAPDVRNAVLCTALEHKMGIHANPTCAMAYDGAVGWLVGEPHRGLAAMFTMMNEARLGVALQGLALADAAYQVALAYARERRQGRAPGQMAGEGPDPIVAHPDVRRMLMAIRSFTISARALILSTALVADEARTGPAEDRAAAEERLALLTPVVKGVLTDRGFEATVLAQQVLGGHGYIADHGLEQFVRDARIAMLYEGTNGIQAQDLVVRKLPRDGGRAFAAWTAEAEALRVAAAADPALLDLAGGLEAGLADLAAAADWLSRCGDEAVVAAAATDFMHLFGVVALGAMWVRIAQADRATGGSASPGAGARRHLADFFLCQTMPETALRLARIRAGTGPVVAMPPDAL